MQRFEIIDTTLRDGEQTAGVIFSSDEKLRMLKAMDEAGIKWIEAGIPAIGEQEKYTLKKMLSLNLKANLIAWNRASKEDIKQSIACGFSCLHVSLPVSDLHINYKLRKNRNWVINRLKEILGFMKSYGVDIIVGAEDASRADPQFFLQYAEVAASFGAIRLRYADTIGCLDPFLTYEKLKYIMERTPLPIEFHGHNDFGLATANTLAAFKAKVNFCSVTSVGIGERAGNASLEETIKSLFHLYGYDCGIRFEVIEKLTDLVEEASGRKVFPYKPIIGSMYKKSSI